MRGLLLTLFGLGIIGCSYEFSEEKNFVTVQKPVPGGQVTIDLDQAGDDTLYIYQPVNLKYTVKGVAPASLQHITIGLVNTSTVFTANQLSGTVAFTPPTNTRKIFQLQLRVYSKSGSGSLADHTGMESLVYEREWPVFVNTIAPDRIGITSIAKHNGSLLVSWEKFPYPGFSKYELIRVKGSSYKTFAINDQDSTSFYDKEFLTGQVSYSITLFTGGGENYVPGFATSYSDNSGSPELVSKEIVNNQVKLTWSRGAYPANIKRFEIRIGEGSYFENGSVIQNSMVTTDTTETIPATFGANRYFFVRASPSTTAIWSNDPEHVIKSATFVAGETFDSYDEIRWSTPANRFFTLSQFNLKAYDMTTGAEVRSYAGGGAFEVTQDGSKLVHVFNRNVYVYDATTLNLQFQFDISAQLLSDDHLYTVALSSNNQAYITRSRVMLLGGFQVLIPAILVYDISNGTLVKVIASGPLQPNNTFIVGGGPTRVTDNQFMFYGPYTTNSPGGFTAVVKINGTVISESETFSWMVPNPSNPNEMLNPRYNGNKIAVFNWTTKTYGGTVYNTFSDFVTTGFLPERNLVVGLRAGTVATVFNYATQQTVYQIQCPGFPVELHGDYLYSRFGGRIKIN